jgi:hypothetical protein
LQTQGREPGVDRQLFVRRNMAMWAPRCIRLTAERVWKPLAICGTGGHDPLSWRGMADAQHHSIAVEVGEHADQVAVEVGDQELAK